MVRFVECMWSCIWFEFNNKLFAKVPRPLKIFQNCFSGLHSSVDMVALIQAARFKVVMAGRQVTFEFIHHIYLLL